MCNKMAFASRSEARAAARDVKRKNSQQGGDRGRAAGARRLTPYECQRCGSWHLTSIPKVIQRRRFPRPHST